MSDEENPSLLYVARQLHEAQKETDALRNYVAKLSVDFEEMKGHVYTACSIMTLLLAAILYKVW